MSSTNFTPLLAILCFAIVSYYPESEEKGMRIAQVWSEKDYQGSTANLMILSSIECTAFPDDFKEAVRSLKVFNTIGSVWFFKEEGCTDLQLKMNPKQEIPNLDEVVGVPSNYSLKFYAFLGI